MRAVCLILLALIGISPVLSPVEASGATSSTGVSVSGNPPYGGCREAVQYPQSPGARWCRERGWTITRHLSISPKGAARTDFAPCRQEDSRRCYWNARTMGNGRGDSFVNHGKLGVFYSLTRINGQRA